MTLDADIKKHIGELPSDKLIQMVDNASQYLPEAIAYAQGEIARRGGRSALLHEIASSRDAEIACGIAERQKWERLPCGGLFSSEGRYSRARYFCTIFAAGGVMYVFHVIIAVACGKAEVFAVDWFGWLGWLVWLIAVGWLGWLIAVGWLVWLIAVGWLGWLIAVGWLIVLPITLVAAAKRFHDINRPGANVLGLLIPFYNIYLGLILLCREGTKGANQYGPDPLAQKQRGD